MSETETLNVYFYALYDAYDQQAHSGLTMAYCEANVRRDIKANYLYPRYITVRCVPELVGIVDEDGNERTLRRADYMKEQAVIRCETCGLHGECKVEINKEVKL